MSELFMGKIAMLRNFTEQLYNLETTKWAASYSYAVPKTAPKSVVLLTLYLGAEDLAQHTPDSLNRIMVQRVLATAAEYRAQFPELAAEFEARQKQGKR